MTIETHNDIEFLNLNGKLYTKDSVRLAIHNQFKMTDAELATYYPDEDVATIKAQWAAEFGEQPEE